MEYKDIEEVKGLSLSDFISYCEMVNADISTCDDGELCRGKDDYLSLKSIEDKYILLSLRNVAKDSKGMVEGFRFDFSVECEDGDFKRYECEIGSIVLNDGYDTYTIYDKDGKRIPFSFVNVLGCIFKELLEKVILYYKYKESVILTEY